MSADEVTHFAPYGATNALCDETVPRLIAWDQSGGDYVGVRFTTRRDRTTCQDCRTRLGLGPVDPAPQVDWDALVAALAEALTHHVRTVLDTTSAGLPSDAALRERSGVAADCEQRLVRELRHGGALDAFAFDVVIRRVLAARVLAAQPAVAPAERVVRPEVCPSCGSGSAFEVRPPCSLDAFDPDAWHSPSSWRPAEPVVVVEHHMDIEAHAASFSEGYQTAVAQGLADDPALAAEWLVQHDREVAVRALLEAADAWQTGGWLADMPRKGVSRGVLIAGMAQRATTWFRDRAGRIERGELAPRSEGGERS